MALTVPPEHLDLQPGAPFLRGTYRLDRKLGEGGMGQVWAATALYSGNPVAIKVMHAQGGAFALRFRQECRFHTKLRHPNIVRMADAGEDEHGVMYLVMDLLDGLTVRQILHRAKRLDVARALHLAVQLADACAYMHSKGIWHRDLKPENLMVGTKDEVKGHLTLFDFGIAKFADAAERHLITDGMPEVASVRYMPPEQVDPKNRAAIDGRADVYAFGCILYEMITGQHIFLREGVPMSAAQVMTGHLSAQVVPIAELVPDCPDEVWALVQACLARRPEQRAARFEPLAEELRRIVRGLGSAIPADPALRRKLEEDRISEARRAAFVSHQMPASASGGGVGKVARMDLSASVAMAQERLAAQPTEERPRPAPTTVPMAVFAPGGNVVPFERPSSSAKGVGHTARMPEGMPLPVRLTPPGAAPVDPLARTDAIQRGAPATLIDRAPPRLAATMPAGALPLPGAPPRPRRWGRVIAVVVALVALVALLCVAGVWVAIASGRLTTTEGRR